MVKILAPTLLLSLALMNSACLNQISGHGPVNSPIVPESRVDLSPSALSFQEHLQPLLESHCSNCHGSLQAPFIAYTDEVLKNHDNVLAASIVNFKSINSSKLVQQLRLGHNCWSGDCNTDANEMYGAIEQWALAREITPQPEGFTTLAQVVPAAAASGLTTMNFDLREANSDLPIDSQMSLQIRRFDTFSYQIRSPRIISPQALRIKNINILINGVPAHTGGSFTFIDSTTSASAAPGVLLSSSSILVSVGLGLDLNPDNTPQGGPDEDDIQIHFEVLEPYAEPDEVKEF
jgi:hypothetical protein